VYTSDDIERLILLRRATLAGRSIGQIATHPTQELRLLVDEDELAQSQAPSPSPMLRARGDDETITQALRAIENLDSDGLRMALERASIKLSKPALVEQIISPLLERIGDQWREGSMRMASEHLASATLRTFLGNLNGAFPVMADSPRLLVTTPAGQLHELGALIAATAAAAEGWHITYLGPSLPAEEIAAAAQSNRARAIALSIVLPDDAHLNNELSRLGQLLPDNVALLVGGRAASHYSDTLREIGAVRLQDLQGLRTELDALRTDGSRS
jgi:methanogenic corrinoid protein MtbC1